MNDQVTSSNILGITGKTPGAGYGVGKNGGDSPLGDKFQFSNVLGAAIDSPEKTYSDAQNPKDRDPTRQHINNQRNNDNNN